MLYSFAVTQTVPIRYFVIIYSFPHWHKSQLEMGNKGYCIFVCVNTYKYKAAGHIKCEQRHLKGLLGFSSACLFILLI